MAKKVEETRAQWDRPIEFILACLGYAVGFGNVWRFPYLCYKNGGGAFLIPYLICLFAAGLPIFYLELVLGQFSSLGPIGIFQRISPIFEGIGWGMVVLAFLTSVFYNMILGWVLYYLGLSFRSELPWSSCTNEWNSYCRNWEPKKCGASVCHSNLDKEICRETYGDSYGYFNKTCLNGTDLELASQIYNNTNRRGPAEEFFENYILNISEGFHDLGGIQWKLVLVLGVAWVIVFLCLIKGVKSTGKVVYFTATFPYVVLIILMIRGLTLEGAMDGVMFYITPDLSKLTEISVWKDAANQIFFSLSAAFGGLLTMASYNKYENNCYRDALLITFLNCGTSIFAGFAVFSIAGFMAHDLGVKVADVVEDGLGLAFIAYPEAISRLPLSPFWAVIFFFMLLTLGLDSQFAFVETVTTGIQDKFPALRRYGILVVFLTCALGFVCGLPLCTRAGVYIFTLLNDYAAGYCVICLAICELVASCWFYGICRLISDIKLMLGVKKCFPVCFIFGPTGIYWMITWTVVSPLFLACIVAASFIFYTRSSYGDYDFPVDAEMAGWIISALSIGCVPVVAIVKFIYVSCCSNKKCVSLFKASPEWCPAKDRDARRATAGLQSQKGLPPHSTAPYASQQPPPHHPTQMYDTKPQRPESLLESYTEDVRHRSKNKQRDRVTPTGSACGTWGHGSVTGSPQGIIQYIAAAAAWSQQQQHQQAGIPMATYGNPYGYQMGQPHGTLQRERPWSGGGYSGTMGSGYSYPGGGIPAYGTPQEDYYGTLRSTNPPPPYYGWR